MRFQKPPLIAGGFILNMGPDLGSVHERDGLSSFSSACPYNGIRNDDNT